MKAIQSSEEILQNARAFLAYIRPTEFFLIVGEAGQTPEDNQAAQINSILFRHWLEENRSTPEGVDFSVEAIRAAYIALRNASLIKFKTPPVIHKKSQVFTDDRGRVVRDLRREKQEQAQREAEEAAAPRRTFEGELKKAETRAQVNRTIEETRAQIASFRGPSHSKTYQVREAAQKILDATIRNDRTLGGIATAASDIKLLFNKAWD